MKNELPFEEFCQTLQQTNKTFGFFVDWDKCLKNRDDIAIFLNHLNFLLGKNNLKLAIEELFNLLQSKKLNERVYCSHA